MIKSSVTVNEEQALYVIPCGGGYSCLGFDVLEGRYARLAAELVHVNRAFSVPMPALRGTVERYAQFKALQNAASLYHTTTGYRFTCELSPALKGCEGRRVEVETKYGERVRFIVGRSTGWIPCHLQIARRNSSGGGAVSYDEVVRVVKIIS